MAKQVKLKEIIEALECPENWQVYFNKRTGEVFFLDDYDEEQ